MQIGGKHTLAEPLRRVGVKLALPHHLVTGLVGEGSALKQTLSHSGPSLIDGPLDRTGKTLF